MYSASETAYLKIRELIVNGGLRAGDQLVAEDLAKSFGLSRTPVREAILRLQAEMFVSRLDNKRTIVRPWSQDEIEDFVELRVRLAAYTATRAARRVTDAQVAELHAVVLEEGEALASNELALMAEVFEKFYSGILEIADSERLRRISWHLLNPGPLLSLMEHNVARYRDMQHDHREILRALEARDPLWAEAAMTTHVRKSYQLKDFTAPADA